jgi:hypothetical protein
MRLLSIESETRVSAVVSKVFAVLGFRNFELNAFQINVQAKEATRHKASLEKKNNLVNRSEKKIVLKCFIVYRKLRNTSRRIISRKIIKALSIRTIKLIRIETAKWVI